MDKTTDISIRPANPDDYERVLVMRESLWPGELDEHTETLSDYFSEGTPDIEALLVADDGAALLGFAELTIHTEAPGAKTTKIGYLEGWFVDENHRGRGVGRLLMQASEAWAKAAGCSEFASDTEQENERSIAAHKSLGFDVAEEIVYFFKKI